MNKTKYIREFLYNIQKLQGSSKLDNDEVLLCLNSEIERIKSVIQCEIDNTAIIKRLTQ